MVTSYRFKHFAHTIKVINCYLYFCLKTVDPLHRNRGKKIPFFPSTSVLFVGAFPFPLSYSSSSKYKDYKKKWGSMSKVLSCNWRRLLKYKLLFQQKASSFSLSLPPLLVLPPPTSLPLSPSLSPFLSLSHTYTQNLINTPMFSIWF